MLMKTLYVKDAQGNIRVWSINTGPDNLCITWGQLGGATQTKREKVKLNQSGRSIVEQILLQFNSRVSKQLDKGYKETIEEAMASRTNFLELPKPMLATDIKKVKNIDYSNAHVQRKYDGNRCLIANSNGEIIAYTRNGKRINTIAHITREIDVPSGTILDGELYAHGESLQTIVSWIKREQENTKKLSFHAYDIISSQPFQDRSLILSEFNLGSHAAAVPTYSCSSYLAARSLCMEFKEEGYEGAILRWGSAGYEDGKRSKSLLKIKEWNDAEFKVESISVSKDGWGILHLRATNGQPFKATAPGPHFEKEFVAKHPEKFLGEYVTIEYAYLTADGIPFHPVAKAWRS
jgi:DNA ligase-1